MTSTELKIGLTNSARPSSRVLKPTGGAHSNIFGEPQVSVNAPRPKYNQQNSSNFNACMNSTDANEAVEKLREDIIQKREETNAVKETEKPNTKCNTTANGNGSTTKNSTIKTRVPPGGHSSGGFW